MKVFVTGATGYLGQALVPVLLREGHEVVALVRSAEKQALARRLGATPLLGDLANPDSYRDDAAECEAYLHAALESGPDAAARDQLTLQTLLEVGRLGSGRTLVYTSGVWALGACPGPADEQASTAHPAALSAWRPAHERRVLEATSSALATAVLRPGLVYGGKQGLLAGLFASAEQRGAADFVGDGKNRWALVHRDDLAEAYRIILETRSEGVFHAVDGAPMPVAEVARLASEAAGARGRVHPVPLEQARARLGPLADALALDQVVIAPRTRGLGWQPRLASFAQGAMQAYAEWKA